MASLNEMVGHLKFWARVQDSEGFSSPVDFEVIVQQAVVQHNPNYVCTTAVFTVPAREVSAINQLALSLIAQFRANKHAQEAIGRTGDFQFSSDTPFGKQMKLVAYYRTEYERECTSLGLEISGSSKRPIISETTIIDPVYGGMELDTIAQEPPFVNLATPTPPVNGVLVLNWSAVVFSQFSQRWVLHIEGSETIHQPWHSAPVSGIPYINAGTEVVTAVPSQRTLAIKLTDLTMTVGTIHRFLIATRTISGIFGFSNEVEITVPAP